MTHEILTECFLKDRQRLLCVARQRLRNGHDAEDVLQEVFLKAWLHADTLLNEKACSAWLMRICLNACMDYQRKAVRRRETLMEQIYAPNPEETSVENRLWLGELLHSLQSDCRHVAVFYYRDGYSVREIADRLHRPEGTVKGLLFQARKQMKKAAVEQ